MALPTALLIKGLAGIGAIGGVVGGGLLIKKLFQPKDPNEIIKDLGISDCKLEEGQTKTNECELNETKVKAINFTNKPESSEQTVSGLDTSKKLKLVIEKGYDTIDFPSGLRFTITNPDTTTEVVIGTDPNKITLKANTSYDFKVTSDGTKLEKAWDLTTLKGKAGVTCTPTGGNTDITQCDLTTGKINVWKAENDYITDATISETNKKICVTKDTKDHNGGFKFTVTSDISLTPGTQKKATNGIDKLTKEGKSYEIDLKDDNGTKKWFLVEKSTSGS